MIPCMGIELEYAIVDRGTGDVRPIADELLRARAGECTGEVENGAYCWSNELVLHVIEIKTNGPVQTLDGVAEGFQGQVDQINTLLERWNACLMPTAMHPWMDPRRETHIWPHEYADVYGTFDRIFDCRRHGWSNLQSMHLNFPFADDETFGRLHAAIRLVLPILPALAASSPFMDGQATGRLDNRVDVYRMNCANIPSITGQVIPEPVFTPTQYQERILRPIYADLRKHDAEGALMHEWVNARGAIARFERNTIEIRLVDMQECPAADITIARLVSLALEALMAERWCALREQQAFEVEPLSQVLLAVLADTQEGTARIADRAYLRCFGMGDEPSRPLEIWRRLAAELLADAPAMSAHSDAAFKTLLDAQHSPLARRILVSAGNDAPGDGLRRTYAALCRSLADGIPFRQTCD